MEDTSTGEHIEWVQNEFPAWFFVYDLLRDLYVLHLIHEPNQEAHV